ncbi:MAG: hypothetical protein JWP59_4196, partial [Massilia sp.]|nr:hypothetical protein [Massilia sp.]
MKHSTSPRMRQDLSRTATAIAVSLLCAAAGAAHAQNNNPEQAP